MSAPLLADRGGLAFLPMIGAVMATATTTSTALLPRTAPRLEHGSVVATAASLNRNGAVVAAPR